MAAKKKSEAEKACDAFGKAVGGALFVLLSALSGGAAPIAAGGPPAPPPPGGGAKPPPPPPAPPTPVDSSGITDEQLLAAFKAFSEKYSFEDAQNVMTHYGVENVTDLTGDQRKEAYDHVSGS